MEKFFWLDMEMTGLDVNHNVPIEVAVIVTNSKFECLDSFETAIFQSPAELSKMDDWNQKHHSESGLLARIPTGMSMIDAEQKLLDIIDRHWLSAQNLGGQKKLGDSPPSEQKAKADKPILAGNSIHQDRLFISKYFPRLHQKLHYRMLDITSWKVVMQSIFKIEFKKKKKHSALDDIHESIAELQEYLKYFTKT